MIVILVILLSSLMTARMEYCLHGNQELCGRTEKPWTSPTVRVGVLYIILQKMATWDNIITDNKFLIIKIITLLCPKKFGNDDASYICNIIPELSLSVTTWDSVKFDDSPGFLFAILESYDITDVD